MELLRKTSLAKLIAIRFIGVVALALLLVGGVAWIWTDRQGVATGSVSYEHRNNSRVGLRWFFATRGGVIAVGHLSAWYPEPTGSPADRYSMYRIQQEFVYDSMPVWQTQWRNMVAEPRDTLLRKLGFAYTSVQTSFNGIPYQHWWLALPYWFLMIPFAALLPVWFRTEQHEWRVGAQRRRFDRGLCPICGYDVQATPQRCPECGCVLSPWLEGDDRDPKRQFPAGSRQ